MEYDFDGCITLHVTVPEGREFYVPELSVPGPWKFRRFAGDDAVFARPPLDKNWSALPPSIDGVHEIIAMVQGLQSQEPRPTALWDFDRWFLGHPDRNVISLHVCGDCQDACEDFAFLAIGPGAAERALRRWDQHHKQFHSKTFSDTRMQDNCPYCEKRTVNHEALALHIAMRHSECNLNVYDDDDRGATACPACGAKTEVRTNDDLTDGIYPHLERCEAFLELQHLALLNR